MKKVLLILFVVVLLVGLGIGLYLMQNPQLLKPKASCGEDACKATINFNPTTYTVTPGNSTDVKIALDTQGLEINGINIIVNYSATDFTEIQPTDFKLDSGISNWQIAFSKTSPPGKAEFTARYNVTQTSPGYKTTGSVNFAVLTIKGISNSQKTLSFDSASQVTVGVNATDLLFTPSGNATFTVGTGNTTVYYSCQTGGCQADTSGGTDFANDSTCNGTCVATVIKPSVSNLGNDTTLQSSPTVITGSAKPGATVTITIHSVQSLTGTAIANSAGVWTWTLTDTLTNGAHTMTVTDNQTPPQTSSTIAFTITPPATGGSTTQYYRCSGSSCVPDQNGQFTSSNCNSTCTSSTTTTTSTTTTETTLPATASTGDTLAVAALGLVSLAIGTLLFLVH